LGCEVVAPRLPNSEPEVDWGWEVVDGMENKPPDEVACEVGGFNVDPKMLDCC
jgi:hypothetical protein